MHRSGAAHAPSHVQRQSLLLRPRSPRAQSDAQGHQLQPQSHAPLEILLPWPSGAEWMQGCESLAALLKMLSGAIRPFKCT